MMATHHVERVLEDLRARIEGFAAALVSRDGTVLHAHLPSEVRAETWAIMCATVVGAAVTVNRELCLGPPDHVVLESADFRTVIVASGSRALLVATVPAYTDTTTVLTEIGKFADWLASRDVPAASGPS